MNILQQKITETLLNAPSGVHGVFYGFKTTNDQITDVKSIVYYVTEKKPLSAISSDEIIPKNIILNNENYPTDVIQEERFKLNQCYILDDTEPLKLRSRIRPLSGGIEISSLNTWIQTSPYFFNFEIGTMGFLAKDNVDGKLVGVTNNHVIIQDAFVSNEKDPLSGTSSIIDDIVFDDPDGFIATIPQRILQFGSSTGTVNFFSDRIGIPKRYVSISELSANRVDAAIFTINSNTFDVNSNTQAYLQGINTLNIPFATSSEIENLPFNNTLYNVGAMTGPKGNNCPLICYDIGATFINFVRQGVEVETVFTDCIVYRFVDNSNLPIWYGDSGSSLIADIGGQNKIVGLVFAGNSSGDFNNPISTRGLACRIDHVANELNISAWDGSAIETSSNNPTYSYLLAPITETRTSVISGGKTFYLAGTVLTLESPNI